MRYPGALDSFENPLESFLQAQGIEDISAFRKPTEENVVCPLRFRGVGKVIALLNDLQKQKHLRIRVKVDPDVDGYTSAALIKGFFESLNISTTDGQLMVDTVVPIFSEGKQHGLPLESFMGEFEDGTYGLNETFAKESDLIVVPDAGSDSKSIDTYNWLNTLGVPVLVLDHHEPDEALWQCENVAVMNCQDGVYPNSSLTGVGVVRKFIELYELLFEKISPYLKRKWDELVALGMIADVADLRNLETRYYVLRGLEGEKKHPFLKVLEERNEMQMSLGATIMSYGWNIAPLLNAMIRIGTPSDKADLFNALCGETGSVVYQPRRKKASDPKPPKEKISLAEDVARRCVSAKSKQQRIVRENVDRILEDLPEYSLQYDSVIVIDAGQYDWEPALNGLIANRLTTVLQRPVLVGRSANKVFAGSGRGYEDGKIKFFKTTLSDTQLCKSVVGHENAFGVQIDEGKMLHLISTLNEKYPYTPNDVIPTVDYEVALNNFSKPMFSAFAEAYDCWGNHVREPEIVITNIRVNSKDLQEFGNGRFIRFKSGDHYFVKKFCRNGEYDEIIHRDNEPFPKHKDLLLTVIGNCKLEKTENGIYHQFQIKDWYSQIVNDKGFRW